MSWKGEKTLCHSSLAIVVSHMPGNLSLKEKGKKNTLPGGQPSLFPHTPLQVLSVILLTWCYHCSELTWGHATGAMVGKLDLNQFCFPQPLTSHVDHSWAGPELALVGSQQSLWQITCVHESWEILPPKYVLKYQSPMATTSLVSLFFSSGLGALVAVLSTVTEQLLRCEGSCLFWFSPPAASGHEPTTSLTAFQSNQNTSTNHMVTKSFGCFRWKDLCPQRLGQPIIAHSLCLPTSYDCSFHLIFNVAVALPH